MYAKISIVILLFIVCARGQEATLSDDVCAPIKTFCFCEATEPRRIVPLLIHARPTARTHSGNCNYDDPKKICQNLVCISNSTSARKSTIIVPFDVEPTKVIIPAGGKSMTKRHIELCGIGQLNNTIVECWAWPNFKTCDFQCIYGHGFQVPGNGTFTKTQLKCRSTENKWKPHDIYECLPYWNCKPNLITPGTLKCREPDGPVTCDISCEAYDGKEEVPLKTYTCTDSNFADQLPHCAVLKKDVELLENP